VDDTGNSSPGDLSGGNVADASCIAALLAEAARLQLPRLDAEVLLAALLRRGRAQLAAFPESPVDGLTALMFRAGLERLQDGEPLAYITGTREFWSLPLVVSPAVLIPRPETELLVELCLARLDQAPRQVADLGTGSGAIALALASERPQWRIIATDASEAALEIAAINRQRLKLPQVELRQGSWTDALEETRCAAILSNPPYIAAGHPALSALRHEPGAALVAGDDGYADLLAIAAGSRARLEPGGLLLLEHGTGQSPRLARELAALGYADIHSHRDLAGHDRVTGAIWPRG
jgi:release factor glutamine methyltransferase